MTTEHPASAPPLEIRVEDLHKSFGDNHVLRGVDLAVTSGEIVAIVGGSGCGKTVLLDHLIGHIHPDHGRVWITSHDDAGSPLLDLASLTEEEMNRLRAHWAVVFQRNALFSGTVEQNIVLALQWVKGLSPKDARQRARQAIQAVGLDADRVLPISRDDLSGGMAKRVAVARALATDPLLIFYDEPTTGLDPHHSSLIQKLIFETALYEEEGIRRTSIVITHDKDLLRRIQPRILMLHEGRVYFNGPYTEFERSESPVIRPYFESMPIFQRRPNPSQTVGV